MATSEPALTAHLVVRGDGGHDSDALLQRATRELHDRFAIHHVTLQVESERFAAGCEGCG
jgi:cobalt-zinc-cadmium efflux system protein